MSLELPLSKLSCKGPDIFDASQIERAIKLTEYYMKGNYLPPILVRRRNAHYTVDNNSVTVFIVAYVLGLQTVKVEILC